ncbi:Putative ABC transporter [Cutibacterium avidum 44067]|nr:Putative ABC transporter [Cutibacterium avidum 44067]ERF56534.1 Putative ABC transporter [Cutibacterium avidum TM16]
MSFGRAVKLFFKNYAVFNGRASRSEYWWVILFSSLVGMVFGGPQRRRGRISRRPVDGLHSAEHHLVPGHPHPRALDCRAPPARHPSLRVVAAPLHLPSHWLDLVAGLLHLGYRRKCVADQRQGATARH